MQIKELLSVTSEFGYSFSFLLVNIFRNFLSVYRLYNFVFLIEILLITKFKKKNTANE